jgi:uncharacterized protein YgbK (DUF1537 family)
LTGLQPSLQAKGLVLRIGTIAPLVAIIADDLTGALDVSAPFARRGLRVQIAVSLEGLASAVMADADLVCVNTGSRELPAESAVRRIAEAASKLAQTAPAIVFNKIDSRLKGHVKLGIETCLEMFERKNAVLAPAIPAQGRLVRDGRIVGGGVPAPIDIAANLGRVEGIAVVDGATEEDMERLARQIDPKKTLLVGASGLGSGLARALTDAAAEPFLPPKLPMLFAIGSHDPVTQAQIERLRTLEDCDVYESANGYFDDDLAATRVTLAHAVSQPDHPDHSSTLAQFGRSVAEQLHMNRFQCVFLCGGETAQTVLDELGIQTLTLRGEAASGIPLCEAHFCGHPLTILTKSGGFGTPDDLLRLAEVAHSTAPIHPL